MIIKKLTGNIEIWREECREEVAVGKSIWTKWGRVVVDSIRGNEATVSYDTSAMPVIRYQRPRPTKN